MPNQSSTGSMQRCSRSVSYSQVQNVCFNRATSCGCKISGSMLPLWTQFQRICWLIQVWGNNLSKRRFNTAAKHDALDIKTNKVANYFLLQHQVRSVVSSHFRFLDTRQVPKLVRTRYRTNWSSCFCRFMNQLPFPAHLSKPRQTAMNYTWQPFPRNSSPDGSLPNI